MTSAARLSLHVPEPTVRPGGSPDFSHVGIAEAGEVPRPPIDVSPSEIRNFAYTMIRALDDNCEAVGEWAGSLNADDLRKGLRDMMLTRAFDARMLIAQRLNQTLVISLDGFRHRVDFLFYFFVVHHAGVRTRTVDRLCRSLDRHSFGHGCPGFRHL